MAQHYMKYDEYYNINNGCGEGSSSGRRLLGVSVYHLCTIFQPEVMLFASENLKRDTSSGLTIYDIENNFGRGFIQEKTNNNHNRYNTDYYDSHDDASLGSYAETLSGCDHVGEVTHMLSYSWGNKIDDIISSLAAFCEIDGLSTKRTYIWLCCLCQNQKKFIQESDDDSYWKRFEQQIVDIHDILVLMVPPQSLPTISTPDDHSYSPVNTSVMPLYLDRVWCIYELYTALVYKCNVRVIMPPTEKEQFLKSIIDQTTAGRGGRLQEFIVALSSDEYGQGEDTKIKIEFARTYRPEDKHAILKWLRNNNEGYSLVNAAVTTFMKDWVDSVMVEDAVRMAELNSRNRTTDLNLAVMYKTIGLVYNNDKDDTHRALQYLEKSQAVHEKVLTNVYNDIGSVLLKHKPHQAKEFFEKSLVVIAAEQNVNDEDLIFKTYKNLNMVHAKLNSLHFG